MTHVPTMPGFSEQFESASPIGPALFSMVFDKVEQIVLHLAWREAQLQHSFDKISFRGLGRRLGRREPLPLADEKLEALRRYAVYLKRAQESGFYPDAKELMHVGYSARQIEALHLAFDGAAFVQVENTTSGALS